MKEVDHKPVLMDFQKQLNYRERKAEAKTEEEGGVKTKKKAIRALRDRARYLKMKMAIAESQDKRPSGTDGAAQNGASQY